MRPSAVLFAIAGLVATPSAALAQQPAPAPVVPAPVQTQMKLSVERVGGKLATALVGAQIRVRGTIATFVPGEKVIVRFYDQQSRLRVTTRPILGGPNGTGRFVLGHTPRRSGRLVVKASHAPTAALGELKATARSVDVIPRRVGPSSTKRAIRALQRRLTRLGYVVGSRGVYDGRTARAVLAFRKVTGMRRTTSATTEVMRRIARGKGSFRIRRPSHGRHIEADLSRQVIALIEGGKVRRIYPVSTGAPSTPTIIGSFRVYRRSPGTNAKGMVHSAYFIRGYATHGFASVPVYPASHGCLRVPIPDALSLFNWIRIGTPVDVYH